MDDLEIGHQEASLAESFFLKNDLKSAIHHHKKASFLFKNCLNNQENLLNIKTKETLNLLFKYHLQKADDLQRQLMKKNNLMVREEKYIDPFEKFWENVETLVNNGKGAVAFTTAAQILANNEQENCDISNDPANLQEQFGSYFIVPRTENFTDVNLKFSFSSPLNAENHLHRFKNPLVGGKSNKKSFEELELENELLKKTLNELTLRMELAEKAKKENYLLKSSIIQFKQDFHKNQNAAGSSSLNSKGRYSSALNTSRGDCFPAEKVSASENLKIMRLEREIENLKKKNTNLEEKWNNLKEVAKKRLKEGEKLSSNSNNTHHQ